MWLKNETQLCLNNTWSQTLAHIQTRNIHENTYCLHRLWYHNSCIVPTLQGETTALHWAAQKGHLDCLNALVEAGAKVDAESHVRMNIIATHAKWFYWHMHSGVKCVFVFMQISIASNHNQPHIAPHSQWLSDFTPWFHSSQFCRTLELVNQWDCFVVSCYSCLGWRWSWCWGGFAGRAGAGLCR